MGFQLIMLFGKILAAMAATAIGPRQDCPDRCGDVRIPYPFGIGEGCYNHESLNLSCKETGSGTLPILYIYNSAFRVINISLEGQVSMESRIAHVCYDKSGMPALDSKAYNTPTVQLPKNNYAISRSLNKLTVVGCDSSGTVQWGKYATGCTSKCDSTRHVANGNCTGFGCCQISLPPELKYYTRLNASSFNNHTEVWDFSRCTFAFVVEADKFNFSKHYLNIKTRAEFLKLNLSTAIDWTIGKETCQIAKDNKISFACQNNSECYTPESIGQGYRCKCKAGYQGNPYNISNGCEDINECSNKDLNNCTKLETCVNEEGSYKCSPHESPVIKIVASVAIIVTVPLICSTWLYLEYKKRKLQRKFYVQNGGELLAKKLEERGASIKAILIKPEELKKATDFGPSSLIGRGGFGTVYRGTLNGTNVAIKITKMGHPSLKGQFIAEKSQNDVYQNLKEQFIKEVVVLSTINHKNVVRLLGCCLGKQEPVLVYQLFSKGSLFNYINDERLRSKINWELRLKIATGTAMALSYLHSETNDYIIHGDVKSANILLDDDFTAKVIDFGSSRFVASDQNQLVTTVQGTQGYLAPEYLETQQFTMESDVYSFGVVFAELLTGKVANSFNVHGNEGTLVSKFRSLKKDLIPIGFDECMKEENKEQLKQAAILAEKCLSVKMDERPTMAEVITELTKIQNGKRETDTSTHGSNPEETVSRDIENDVGPSMLSPDDVEQAVEEFNS